MNAWEGRTRYEKNLERSTRTRIFNVAERAENRMRAMNTIFGHDYYRWKYTPLIALHMSSCFNSNWNEKMYLHKISLRSNNVREDITYVRMGAYVCSVCAYGPEQLKLISNMLHCKVGRYNTCTIVYITRYGNYLLSEVYLNN